MNSELATERDPLKTQPSLGKQAIRPAFLKTVNLRTIEGKRRMNSFKNQVWRDRALMVYIYVLRFISLITRSPFASKFSLLDKNMFRIIGDKAADFNYYLLHDYFKYMKPQPASKVKYFMQKHLYKYCRMKGTWEYLASLNLTLEPESLILLIWNILLLIFINLNILYVTVKFAFDFANQPPEHAKTYETCFLVIPFYAYLLDILLKLNTGFYESGYLVKDRNKIWTNFYHNSFLINLIIVLFASIYMLVLQDSSLYLILVLKAFEIPNILESIIDRVELTTNYWVLYDLVRLIVVILYESHICCCGLYYVGLLDTEKSWIITQNIMYDTWIEKYLNTFYWSIITMTTIGYGDMIPQNLIEKGYLIFVAIFSCCTFGYSITCIGQILGQLQSKNHQIRMDLNDLKQYLRIRGYNNKLQIKIIRFFEYVWKDSRNENKLDLQKFQQQLPQHLHNVILRLLQEMMIDLNMKSISKIPFFKDNFNEDFISALASKFSEEKLVPFNTIFQKDDPSNYLYILCDGEIEFYVEIPAGSTHILSIQSIGGTDEIFGQQEFLLDQNYDINCRSTKMTRILKISKTDFQLIAKKYGYEKYCQLKDLVKFSGRYDEFHLNCVGCNKSTHMLYQCPMLTGFPNKTKIIISYRKNQFQERKYQNRNNLKRRLSSLIFEAQISDTVLYYLLKDPKLSQQISSQYYIQTMRQQQHLQQQQQQQQSEQKQFNVTFQEDEVKEEPRKQSILNIKGRKQSNYIKRLPDFLNGTYINFRSMPESKIKSALESMSNNSQLNSQESGTPDRQTPSRQTPDRLTPDSRVHFKRIVKEPERKQQVKAKTSIFVTSQDEMNQYEANRISNDVAKIMPIKTISQDINWEKEKERTTHLEQHDKQYLKPILRLNSIVNQEKKDSVTYSALENSSVSQESETNSQENQQSNPSINLIQQIYMGKYKDIFEEFDRSQDFIYYMTHMNVTKIIEQLNQYKETQNFTDFMNVNFVKKRRSKRTKVVIKIDEFRSVLKFSQLNQSLNSFVKKYKVTPKIPVNIPPQPLKADKNRSSKPIEQNQEATEDYLKQKYLLSKAKPIDIFEKDEFSHMNRPQQLQFHQQFKETEQRYKEELDVLKLHTTGESLVDDFHIPKKFLRGLDLQRLKGRKLIKDIFSFKQPRFFKRCKFNSIREWKKYMILKKPRFNNLIMEKIKRYPGTEKGPLPMNDKKGFTQWFNENHGQKTIEAVRTLARRAKRLPKDPEQALMQQSLRFEELMMKEREIKFHVPERKKEAKWKIAAAGPALFCKETMVEQYLKGNPLQDLERNLYVRLQSHIPDGEVPPLPDKHPLEKEKLIAYLERWTFYRSLQTWELARDILNGQVKQTKSEPIKTASLNTYYQLLPKYLRDDPNVKNVYRGLEFANNHMTLEAKEKALNFAAKLTLPFDELNEEVFTAGSSGYKDHVSRFDEERLIQDQENDHVDQAIAPDVTFKYLEQRKHTPLHVAKDDYKLPDWAVDKQERIDDLPVDYYINDDGFWDDYIAAKEQKHLTDSPIQKGKAFFRHQ